MKPFGYIFTIGAFAAASKSFNYTTLASSPLISSQTIEENNLSIIEQVQECSIQDLDFVKCFQKLKKNFTWTQDDKDFYDRVLAYPLKLLLSDSIDLYYRPILEIINDKYIIPCQQFVDKFCEILPLSCNLARHDISRSFISEDNYVEPEEFFYIVAHYYPLEMKKQFRRNYLFINHIIEQNKDSFISPRNFENITFLKNLSEYFISDWEKIEKVASAFRYLSFTPRLPSNRGSLFTASQGMFILSQLSGESLICDKSVRAISNLTEPNELHLFEIGINLTEAFLSPDTLENYFFGDQKEILIILAHTLQNASEKCNQTFGPYHYISFLRKVFDFRFLHLGNLWNFERFFEDARSINYMKMVHQKMSVYYDDLEFIKNVTKISTQLHALNPSFQSLRIEKSCKYLDFFALVKNKSFFEIAKPICESMDDSTKQKSFVHDLLTISDAQITNIDQFWHIFSRQTDKFRSILCIFPLCNHHLTRKENEFLLLAGQVKKGDDMDVFSNVEIESLSALINEFQL